jgi:hypothetical protein
MMRIGLVLLLMPVLLVPTFAPAQTSAASVAYQPKFAGDKAHSDAEAVALGYMRTIVAAQKIYKKKHGNYATSLAALVGHGSFTRRMVDTHRGDYTAVFKAKSDGYWLTMTPRQFDAEHRAFYVDERGVFRGSDSGPAGSSSAELE